MAQNDKDPESAKFTKIRRKMNTQMNKDTLIALTEAFSKGTKNEKETLDQLKKTLAQNHPIFSVETDAMSFGHEHWDFSFTVHYFERSEAGYNKPDGYGNNTTPASCFTIEGIIRIKLQRTADNTIDMKYNTTLQGKYERADIDMDKALISLNDCVIGTRQ